jgi:heat shock protein HslJ
MVTVAKVCPSENQAGEIEMTKLFNALMVTAVFSVAAVAQTSLGNTRWELTHVNGKIVAASNAYIEFDENQKRMTGSTGCNRMFGAYESDGSKFKVKGFGTTKMACLQSEAMETEAAFLEALNNDVSAVRLRGQVLTMYHGKVPVLKFKAATAQAASDDLPSRKWLLRSIRGTRVNLGNEVPFLNFDSEKRSAGGNSGCNVFGGNYEASGSKVKFSDIISTMRACEFEDRMTIERGFLDGLQNADRFEIKGEKLFVYKGTTLLLEFEGTAK